MLNDFLYTLRNWRLVHLMGITTLRTRYARSKFGQTWLSITTLVQILCTGLVWSLIWRMQISEYLPYVGVGHIVYLFISQTINDSSGAFIADARLYLNDKQPFMLSIGAHIYRNVLTLLHNAPTIIVLLLWSSDVHPNLNWEFLAGLLLAFVFIFFATYFVAAMCTRFRDLIQLVGLLFQLIFLVTPIMWKVTFLPEQYRKYVYINPFASLLELIRNPLIGIAVNEWALLSLCAWTALTILLSLIVYSRMNREIIYWV
ncbi:ABC transporter permease [Pandoraea nosoerga]|uniref:ABC transporter n=2 Tax=Pandoraea nosoerga TaxID=2508296 RepID=A0A5E4USM7_9BURK|nr:ABC transporter permease [Pandoraea nosoerga]MBN4666578.1 ABC transporter permease [Pandoraea nosoerga]MBN4674178.1 ABC transporter permease [Pandoraea nosoerga]MBN4679888.1 ABC transporter permease [Pandoraea nosoerga]MBN4744397.1 ABC transporter permease [Pandoraea nosoerga]VVE02967.1 ABC transporter [Pandoraea nosoerga]